MSEMYQTHCYVAKVKRAYGLGNKARSQVHISQESIYITMLGNSKDVQNCRECSKNNEKGKRSAFVAIGPSIAQPGDTVLLLKASCHFFPPYHGTGISTILLAFPIIVPMLH